MSITTKIVDYLKDNNCKVIVIACNTATTRCMKKLREIYPELIFIGTVPAIDIISMITMQYILKMLIEALCSTPLAYGVIAFLKKKVGDGNV